MNIWIIILSLLSLLFLVLLIVYFIKYKKVKSLLNKDELIINNLIVLEEKTPERKEDETELQYLKRCAMRFQNELAHTTGIKFEENKKMILTILE